MSLSVSGTHDRIQTAIFLAQRRGSPVIKHEWMSEYRLSKSSKVDDDRVPEIPANAVFYRVVKVDAPFDIGRRFLKNDYGFFHRLSKRA